MCGIAGIYNWSGSHANAETVKNMLSRIRYRGPDESGVYANKNIAIGNVRLSIIDLFTGQQPMANADKTIWIVFNGEIFNYIELKDELEKKGYYFNTTSDTEVIINLYQAFGKACVNKLNGQFAFAIWDKNKEQLFLARDRLGIRPLFYTKYNNTLLFGSEIKTFLAYPEFNLSIDAKALSQVFTFWTTLTPKTVFSDVYELPPGHSLTITKKGETVEKYWELSFPEQNSTRNISFEDTIDEFHQIFYDSVKIRLRADVKVAAYLSGGLDSSTTTYYIKQVMPEVLETFSIGFEDREFDETKYQQEVSKYLGTDHTPFYCTNKDIADTFRDVVWHTEIPLLRTGPVPMYLLSKQVRAKGIKVVITGEGADEAFAGYNIFKEALIRQFWAKYPSSKIRPLLLTRLYPYITGLQGKSANMLKFFFGYKLAETQSPYYSHLLRWNNTSSVKFLLSEEYKNKMNAYNPLSEIEEQYAEKLKDLSLLSRAQLIETNIFMSGYLLSSQGDRMAMANSVEGRYPFLDHRLFEFAASLPENFKLNGLNEKLLIKKLMVDKIPESVTKRFKQAYRAPVYNSFMGDNAVDYIIDMFTKKSIEQTGIFDYNQIEKLIKKIKNKGNATEIENMSITAILSTQLINELFIRNSKSSDLLPMDDCKIINEH